jgi:hypothetical protein
MDSAMIGQECIKEATEIGPRPHLAAIDPPGRHRRGERTQ